MAKIGIVKTRMRVAVVDDDEDTRLYLKDVLQSTDSFNFAGGFSSGAEALARMPDLRPDFALMDIGLPDLNGIECTKRLKRAMPHLKIVVMSGRREAGWFDASLNAGAAAYLVKPMDTDQLVATLWFAAVKNQPPGAARWNPGAKAVLNPREKEVLRKLAEGLLYKEISEALGISYAAVHKCQHKIFKKLRVTNRSEAVRVWLQNNGA